MITGKQIDYTKEAVLVVDDDDLLRGTLQQLIAALKCRTASEPSAKAALGRLAVEDFTFLLTDMKMPEMDGLELIKRVSRDYPRISIVAMTGYAEGYRYVDVINAGASDFIKKPFDLEELEAKIARIINERALREELNRLSITDALTGLYNQRHFYARLKEETLRSERQKHPMSLILLDLDRFKDYNDTYGHLAGDDMLRTVGRLISKCIRVGVDSGYRYGGDEFAVVLIDADLTVSQEIGKRIQDALKENGKITASLGISIFSDKMSAEDLIAAADKELYKSKPRNHLTSK